MTSSVTVKDVYTIQEQESGDAEGGRGRWTRIGIGFVNRDDSINIVLDANPVNGRLHVRDRQATRRRSNSDQQEGAPS